MRKLNDFVTILLVATLLAGVSLLLYPTVSDYWNSFHMTEVISDYTEALDNLDDEQYAAIKSAAKAYNRSLLTHIYDFTLSDEEMAEYESMLDVSGNGVMGYVDIPSIQCQLPIYHGTSDVVLQVAVGHIEWSSLPVGGDSTHCVLSGHRGLKSARLFTDLDKLAEGDVFTLNILDEVLTYEIDQIRIVEPTELNDLVREEGEDYCTLVTCTPYGVNSHRLLVRGHRIDNIKETARVSSEAMQVEPMMVAVIVAIPLLVILLIIMLRPRHYVQYIDEDDEEDEDEDDEIF
jgi:sortase A